MLNFLRNLFRRRKVPEPLTEDVDLTQFYTDSEHELRIFEQLVSATNLPKRLLVIHGLGGVGKSTLLKMYRLTCHKYRVPVGLVASEETHSPVDVLADWAGELSYDGM